MSEEIRTPVPFYTHGGIFHCDEVTAFAITVIAGVCDHAVRLTDQADLMDPPSDGVVADIGRIYDTEKLRFDHHQATIRRANGYQLASAGLIWERYGEDAVRAVLGINDDKKVFDVWLRVDENLIMGIDAHDADSKYEVTALTDCDSLVSGMSGLAKVKVKTLPMVIGSYNGPDAGDSRMQDFRFNEAAKVMVDILVAEIKSAHSFVKARDAFACDEWMDGMVLVTEGNVQGWQEIVCEDYPNALFMIGPSAHPGAPFSMVSVPKSAGSREVKMQIERPDWFKGFIHNGKWISGHTSVEEALRLAEYNLSI